MFQKQKIIAFTLSILFLLLIAGSVIFYGWTHSSVESPSLFGSSTETSEKSSQQETSTSTEEVAFSKDLVLLFLQQYYTKKDYGDNRSRYRPLMTEGLYTSEVQFEEEQLNLGLDGYTVDYRFEEANIYLDEEHLVAIVEVSYYVTKLAKKNDYTLLDRDVLTKQNLRLTYKKVDNTILLDDKEEIFIAGKYNIEELNKLYQQYTEFNSEHSH